MSGRTAAITGLMTGQRPTKVTSQTAEVRLAERELAGRYVWPQMRQRAEDERNDRDEWKAADSEHTPLIRTGSIRKERPHMRNRRRR